MTRKKLIEVALPLDAINKASAREESIRHGHPSTLHLWWARRPLAAARAVISSQMVRSPSGSTQHAAVPDLERAEVRMATHLMIDEARLARFCEQHHIRRLSLFGSRLTGKHRPDSDIDLLVEFEPGHVPGLLALAGMEAELSALLDGKPVDLRTPQDLSRYFRDDVLRMAEVKYAR